MRIRNIKIRTWRHFENIEISLGEEKGLVCIVGANGTGKSHILELIAACAHKLGLSTGVDIPRGEPFKDDHDFTLQIHIAEGIVDLIDKDLAQIPGFLQWDRTLTLASHRTDKSESIKITAGGIEDDSEKENVAAHIIGALRNSNSVHFLSLDADRAYPKKNINVNEAAQAYDTDWSTTEFTRGRSFRPTKTLYDEWLKYFLAKENQAGTKLMQEMRRAKEAGSKPPDFNDHFENYSNSLKKVLPHVLFTGVDTKLRTLTFDTTGLRLNFDQMSGGEREIAFLIGQIDRFGLRNGLLLVDEPELHLNADLIRMWVSYLTGTVETGQIWLATHSLEAVEAAGQEASFVLERDEETRKVNSSARLDERPILSTLSRAVGTPAFSISKLIFVFVEGEESVGERERYRKLTALPPNVRFLECGSCNEVFRRVAAVKALANESESGIRIGGIIDRDFRTKSEVTALEEEYGVFVLPVHEIENLFIDPITLNILMTQNGIKNLTPLEIIRNASDSRAGSWIFQNMMAGNLAKSLPEIPTPVKDHVKTLSWAEIDGNEQKVIEKAIDLSNYEFALQNKLESLIKVSVRSYRRKRDYNDLWKISEGKQILNQIARDIGFSSVRTMTNAVYVIWERKGAKLSNEMRKLRSYLNNI
ncbi:AAA family ATPase [uncultured Sneathiella sp.]|uniref:AAA family ATPase n=1 Tax=uncultured Sneathiella sp. TaxID=879315 RepID=UPI002597D9AF|nr:AAA family ATPase [uncultured Sneathiella sp.]